MSSILSENSIAYQIDSAVSRFEILTDAELASGMVGQSYSQLLVGTIFPTWRISAGELAAGITLNAETGEISGTPTESGVFVFTIEGATEDESDTKEFTLKVYPSITTEKLADSVVGASYSQKLNTLGTVTWSLSGGALPDGLTLSSSGVISGKPTRAGTYAFVLSATNSEILTVTRGFTVKIVEQDNTLPVSSAVWTAEHLPPGLSLSTSGLLTGTPTETGTYNSKFTVKTNWGSASRVVKIKVVAAE